VSIRIETRSGTVEGRGRAQHAAFLGIPFAKPPLDALRFRPPEPPEPWAGVRPAREFSRVAMQGMAFAPGVEADGSQSEDCLYLNVFTRGGGDRKRPVLVWIHGGAFVVGSAGLPIYDGGALVELGDVVVVTFNYRLGSFGFLWFGEDAERLDAATNVGLLDQIAALRWVHDNIAAFGGDPENVTLFGESAGASSVCLLLTAPAARGLFQRAVSQSSAAGTRLPSHEAAARTTHLLLEKLGLARAQIEQLRALPAEQIAKAQRAVELSSLGFQVFFPVLDDSSLPQHPADVLAGPERPTQPLLLGCNRDEWNLFEAGNVVQWGAPLSQDELVERVSKRVPRAAHEQVVQLIDAYLGSRKALGLPHDARALLRAIDGDLRFRIPSLRFAEAYLESQAPVFMYLFSYASPALRGLLGACHALELPFVFGTLSAKGQDRFAGTGPAVQALSETMMRSWLSFAEHGEPRALPAWQPYDLAQRPTLVFDLQSRLALDPLGEERRAWDGIL
jgi:para-nitrobenzyl esterase